MIKRKKWLAVFLFLCLLLFAFSATPIKIYAAAHPVATFDQLQAALTDSGDTIEITITANFGMEATVIIPEDKAVSITSDGGPFTLTRGADITGDLFTVSVGASLTLSDIAIDGNKTVVPDADGCLIKVEEDGELAINDGALLQNNAGNGAIINAGTFTMFGGIITENSSVEYGGGVNNQGIFEMSGGAISGNNAENGGGVFSYGDGYDVYFTLSGGAISGNAASNNGGGVFNGGYESEAEFSDAYFTMSGGEISGNTAANNGGGVFNFVRYFYQSRETDLWYFCNAIFQMSGGEISGNDAINDGGGVYNFVGICQLSGGALYGNRALSGSGGGAFNNCGIMELSGGTIRNNTAATDGGGVFNQCGTARANYAYIFKDMGILKISSGTISSNTAKNNGGGVYSYIDDYSTAFVSFSMSGGTINGNNAFCDGGGIYIDDSDFQLSGGTICDNIAGANGGGIFNLGGIRSVGAYGERFVIVQMSGGKISGNTANVDGGGVFIQNCDFQLSGGTICDNIAGANGGGIFNLGGIRITGVEGYERFVIVQMSGGKISGNTANVDGGGVFIQNCDFQLSGGTICDNIAGANGGGMFNLGGEVYVGWHAGLYEYRFGGVQMSGGEIKNNTANVDGGGMYNTSEGAVEMTGGEIKNNTAIVDGGGLYTEDYANIELPAGSSIAFSGNTANHPCNPPAAAPVPADQWQGAITSTSLRIPGDKNITVFNNFDINFDGEPFPGPYPVIYHANNGSGGVIDTDSKFPYQPFPAAANTFAAPDGKRFAGWNTKADGSGTTYLPGDEAVMPNEPSPFTFHLYAMWEPISITPVTARPPKTGDTNALLLYEMLLCAAIGLAGFAVSFSKKKRIT